MIPMFYDTAPHIRGRYAFADRHFGNARMPFWRVLAGTAQKALATLMTVVQTAYAARFNAA